ACRFGFESVGAVGFAVGHDHVEVLVPTEGLQLMGGRVVADDGGFAPAFAERDDLEMKTLAAEPGEPPRRALHHPAFDGAPDAVLFEREQRCGAGDLLVEGRRMAWVALFAPQLAQPLVFFTESADDSEFRKPKQEQLEPHEQFEAAGLVERAVEIAEPSFVVVMVSHEQPRSRGRRAFPEWRAAHRLDALDRARGAGARGRYARRGRGQDRPWRRRRVRREEHRDRARDRSELLGATVR